MRPILPPDGGLIHVYSAVLPDKLPGAPAMLVFLEIQGGPFITLTPGQWSDLVRRIRRAPTAADLGA